MWMLEQRAPTSTARRNTQAAIDSFVGAYASRAAHLLTPDLLRDCAIQGASEILMRCMGQFQTGYLYCGLTLASAPVQRAVQYAAALLRGQTSLL